MTYSENGNAALFIDKAHMDFVNTQLTRAIYGATLFTILLSETNPRIAMDLINDGTLNTQGITHAFIGHYDSLPETVDLSEAILQKTPQIIRIALGDDLDFLSGQTHKFTWNDLYNSRIIHKMRYSLANF